MNNDYQFQVLEDVEKLSGYYMYKNGELVPYDGSETNQVVLLEKWTLKDLQKNRPEIYKKLASSQKEK